MRSLEKTAKTLAQRRTNFFSNRMAPYHWFQFGVRYRSLRAWAEPLPENPPQLVKSRIGTKVQFDCSRQLFVQRSRPLHLGPSANRLQGLFRTTGLELTG